MLAFSGEAYHTAIGEDYHIDSIV